MTGDVMMAVGDFRFSINTAAYEELSRSASYRWVSQARVGRRPAQQYVGPGEETLRLSGRVYPHFRGGLGQIKAMRDIAETGEPQLIVDGLGYVSGLWVIKQVTEGQTRIDGEGIPRRQDFSLELARYGEDA